jgi:hypothetical protein
MTERLTSQDEAEYIRSCIMRTVDKMEDRSSLTRGQIGAAMIGIGGGLVAAHAGHERCLSVLDGARDALLADKPHS